MMHLLRHLTVAQYHFVRNAGGFHSLVFLLGFFLLASSSLGQDLPVAHPEFYVPPVKSPPAKKLALDLPPSLEVNLVAPPRLGLGPVRDSEFERLKPEEGLVRIGLVRDVEAGANRAGAWETLQDGRRLWRLAISSQEAVGLRVHFVDFAVGAGRVWVYSGASIEDIDGPYTGRGIFGDGEFWSSTIRSHSIVVEYEPDVPEWHSLETPFRIAGVAHHWTSISSLLGSASTTETGQSCDLPQTDLFDSPAPIQSKMCSTPDPKELPKDNIDRAARCHLDAMCFPGLDQVVSAVAVYEFVENERGCFVCSGTLLADDLPDRDVPYFLTANHCVSTQAQARSVITYWGYQNRGCFAPPNVPPLSSLPKVNGATLLAAGDWSQGDWAFLLLPQMPPASRAGWDPNELRMGWPVAMMGHPRGSFTRVATGRRVQDRGANTTDNEGNVVGFAPADKYYRVRHEQGVLEGGMSGGAVFKAATSDQPGILVGVNSHGGGSRVSDVCAISPFESGLGRFSEIYPHLRHFLRDEKDPPPPPRGTLTATPNPITSCNSNGTGKTTLTWNAPGVSRVEIRLDSPSGRLVREGGSSGSWTTGDWVPNGKRFYLVEAGSGNQLATVTVAVRCGGSTPPPPPPDPPPGPTTGQISASPNPITSCNSNGTGRTTLTWNVSGVSRVEIRLDSPTGRLVQGGGSSGSWTTGDWVPNGKRFYLVESGTGKQLATMTVAVRCGGAGPPPPPPPPPPPTQEAEITADPNPVTSCRGTSDLGRTKLSWNAPGVNKVDLRIGSPSGKSMGTKNPSGSLETGDWVRDGAVFILLEASTTRELARVTVRVQCASAPPPPPPSGRPAEITSPPNGATLTSSRVTFQWSTGQGVTEYHLQVGSRQGGNDIFDRFMGAARSVTVSVPTDGRRIYARLSSRVNGTWRFRDSQYTARGAAQEFEVLQSMITRERITADGSCPSPQPDSSFLNIEEGATVYFRVRGVSTGDVFEFQWRDRTGVIRRSSRATARSADQCVWDRLPIAGDSSPGSRTGAWSVRVSRNGREILQQRFSVVRVPSAVISRNTSPTCSPPPATDSLSRSDAQAVLHYQVANGLEIGDRLQIEWRDPNGGLHDMRRSWPTVQVSGTGCFQDRLRIAGEPPSLRPGRWTASVFLNDSFLFFVPFTIR